MAIVFKGFHSPVVGKTKVLYDQDLVRQDLINHFHTIKGERAMDTSYGFIGWDLIFEIDNFSVKDLLEADARRIVSLDPRLKLLYINVATVEKGYTINMRLEYVQLNHVEDLSLEFDQRAEQRLITFSIV